MYYKLQFVYMSSANLTSLYLLWLGKERIQLFLHCCWTLTQML